MVLVGVIGSVAGRLGADDAVLLRRGILFTGGFMLLLLALIAIFRRRIMALSMSKAAGIFGVHLLRIFTNMGLLALQWHVAVPQVGWKTWAIFIGLQMAVARLPLIPAKDLFFTELAVQLAPSLLAAPALLAGLFVASSGLNLVMHAVMYLVGQIAGVDAPVLTPLEARRARPLSSNSGSAAG